MKAKPSAVLLNDKPLKETPDGEGYAWALLDKGGLLTVKRQKGDRVIVVE